MTEIKAETPNDSHEGYDIAAVEAWLAAHIPALQPPLSWSRLPGVHSNLTYLIQAKDGPEAVIRRPPLCEFFPKAHDMPR